MRVGFRLCIPPVVVIAAMVTAAASFAQAPAAPSTVPAPVPPVVNETHVPTARGLALARQLVTVIGAEAGMAKIVKAMSEPVARQFETQVAALPPAKRQAAIEAFSTAQSQAESGHIQRELAHAAENFASHMSEDQLEFLVGFYRTPLGQKMIQSPQTVTVEEKQEAGRYMLAHPDTFTAIAALLSSTKIGEPWQVSEQRVYQAGFQADLCSRLHGLAIDYSICVAPGSTGVSTLLHPDDYPALAMRMHHEGIVHYRIGFGQDGAVNSCVVTGSSGYPELDSATCTILRRRAHNHPARAGAAAGVLSWKLPA